MGWQELRQIILDDATNVGPGGQLAPDAEFARRAGCSVPTVKRAMSDLARRGVVSRRRGKRTIVADGNAVVSGTDFSFSRSAHGDHKLVTRLIEKSLRLPSRLAPAQYEGRAHRALGLRRNQPFIAIARLRVLDGTPRVIHRSFLNPGHYPPTFLVSHDFETESLLDIYESHGLRIHSRDTRIRAALATGADAALLAIGREPVLNVEQTMYAIELHTGSVATAEYLHATYANWEYVISDRK